ncbi:NAD(P)-binding protein [Coniophora puteana RWD-64-598 SS2]|uniref:NAD(P)-binding protein n=1 Tax=Coniophora puteana (strain RWD-64-598) TaxID=741705 RepID=A0A5M3M7J1_CONPW|nr:NAD(P)-binding protein [Coniophora puteana RWD-64-598 SS2]EIW74750.1 NAD(P)-binding protein [Coniophora puteana RWD-64-598 SS2]
MRSSPRPSDSASPIAPLGVEAAEKAASDPSYKPTSKIFDEFALTDRVGIVTGGNAGIGLEIALAFCEAGARAVYCLDIASAPSEEWTACRDFVEKLGNGSRLEYVAADVRDQKAMWKAVEEIGDREQRVDMCVANAGVLRPPIPCLEVTTAQFQDVMGINVNGVLYTAQAAGRQMSRFGRPGSIITIGSISGSLTNRDHAWIPYNTSKSAVLQMTRSLACELGPKNIRVNSLSPGYIYTNMTKAFLDRTPGQLEIWSDLNPLKRIGRPNELRGVATWLASDASSFCTGSDILVSGGHHAW